MLASSREALGLPIRQYKQVASWIGEKLSRTKLNGHLLSRSPLSDLVEFEFIATAVLAKRAGFVNVRFRTAHEMQKDVPGGSRTFPIFLMVAERR